VIDLSSDYFNSELKSPTPDEILKYVSDYDIYRAYISNFEVGKVINSPLRRDEHPSFSFFYNKKANKIFFKDFKEGITGDVFTFLKLKFPGLTFDQILQDITYTFSLDDKFYSGYNIQGRKRFNSRTAKEHLTAIKRHDIKRIRIKSRNWVEYDLMFWSSYGVSLQTLEHYNVIPVEYIFIENLSRGHEKIIKADRYAYGYYENKDYITYKIYQPYSREMKFISSHDSTVHSGYNQLPGVGDFLIITKSLKDVMAIVENSKIPSVAIQSETVLIKDKVIDEYKTRFKNVVTLFDNDQTGKTLSNKYLEAYNIRGLIIPKHKKFPITDYSDIIKFINKNTAIEMLKNLLFNETY